MLSFFQKLLKVPKWGFSRIFICPDKPLPPPLPSLIDWGMYKCFPELRKRLQARRLDGAVAIVRKNYATQMARIRSKVGNGGKVHVMFIVEELAKWKAASLYEAMRQSDIFEPVIGLTYPTDRYGATPRQNEERIRETKKWFESNGYECRVIYNAVKNKLLDIESFRPDVVFYPEVWYENRKHSPVRVSRFALTCYIPYFVPNYVIVDLDCRQNMHRLYWRHFVLNDNLARLYRDSTSDGTMAGEFVGLGHTMFDAITACRNGVSDFSHGRRVIYAPHWTFDHPRNPCPVHYSTFVQDGRTILEYAKQHREIEWVFKPHPNLRERVVSSGLMSPEQIDGYYAEWGQVGEVCLSSDYNRLFADSMAMITDCGSFLSEYGATGHPIIHLLSPQNKEVPPESIKRLYDTYYQVHNEKELYTWLTTILEEGRDPNKSERLRALEAVGFLGQNAARNILEYLNKAFGS